MNIKNNQPSTRRIMISVSSDTASLLDKIAEKYNVTKSNVIAILLAKYGAKEFEIDQQENGRERA